MAEGGGPALPIVPAGKWRRFFNWLIDHAVLYALTIALMAALLVVAGESWIARFEALGFWQQQLIDIGLVVAYYVALEGLFGVSVGKLLTGTRVVDERGHPPTLQHARVRSLCRRIPFEALSLAFSEDGRARGWHDSIARTQVVRRGSAGASARGHL